MDVLAILDHLSMQLEPSCSGSSLIELQFCDQASLLRPPDKVAVKDILLGVGGSALVHVLAVFVTMLLPSMQSPLTPQESYVTVSLVEMGGGGSDVCGPGNSNSALGGVQMEAPPAAEGEEAKTVAQAPQRTVRQCERAIVSIERTAKRAPQALSSKPGPNQPAAVAALGKPPVLAASPSPYGRSETVLTGAAEGKGQGATGTGEGSGALVTGGSSAGAGEHCGEFNADAVDKSPQALQKVEPVYPPRARKEGVSGRVVLKFLVNPDGHVSRPSVLEANPSGYFEQTTLDAIRRWRFRPGIFRGKAVATWVVLPVQFKLTE